MHAIVAHGQQKSTKHKQGPAKEQAAVHVQKRKRALGSKSTQTAANKSRKQSASTTAISSANPARRSSRMKTPSQTLKESVSQT